MNIFEEVIEKLLTVNKYSRPGTKRQKTTKIAVHYVANPGTTATANRNYFENCRKTGTYVSSHYVIGLKGEIIRCVPDDEIAYCTNDANPYSISIECCHPDWTGKFTDKTYASLVQLCAALLRKYSLTADDLIRHHDVTGKVCPKCFVAASKGGTDDEELTAWKRFRADVAAELTADSKATASAETTAQPSEEAPPTAPEPFLVRVTCAALNVRSGAGLHNPIKQVVRRGEVFTIVDTAEVAGATWGKLKSGAGWINITAKYCKRV